MKGGKRTGGQGATRTHTETAAEEGKGAGEGKR